MKQTINGYTLCERHAQSWRDGGNDVQMWDVNPDDAVDGPLVCADCSEEAARAEYEALKPEATERYDYRGQRGGTHAECMAAANDANAPTENGPA